jgi:hypothetical protein
LAVHRNKIEHVTHLRARGFAFKVLPGGFLIHFPHAKSPARQLWDAGKLEQRKTMDSLFKRFYRWAKQERAMQEGRAVLTCSLLKKMTRLQAAAERRMREEELMDA